MTRLQRSVTFRRQGSSGLVWDDKLISGELNQSAKTEDDAQAQPPDQQDQVKEAEPWSAVGSINNTIDQSRSNGGGRAFRTGKVSPAIEPPSPRVSACGFCSALGKKDKTRCRPPKSSGRKRSGEYSGDNVHHYGWCLGL
ncbi:uncharacterized protein At1g15400-like [Actinidia eriantha]|uniref:uncharacterized protein At1g15400-like n=1 Tax=Actinidia eriantha TaxID=165200 RepID=UPI002583B309|nr:uncharacterized protein At1g15400-like [Actinidia eriantha]